MGLKEEKKEENLNQNQKEDVKNVDVKHAYVKNKFIVIKLPAVKKQRKRKRKLNLKKGAGKEQDVHQEKEGLAGRIEGNKIGRKMKVIMDQ